MKKQGVTFVVVRALARQLQSQADFLFRLVGEEERTIPQMQADVQSTLVTNRKSNLSNAEMDTPPADWLARKAAGGPPAHWLQRVQQDAPELLTSRGHASRNPLPSLQTEISEPPIVDEASLPNQLEAVANDTQWPTHEEDVPIASIREERWPTMKRVVTPAWQFKNRSAHAISQSAAQLARQKPELHTHAQDVLPSRPSYQQNWDTLKMAAETEDIQTHRLAPVATPQNWDTLKMAAETEDIQTHRLTPSIEQPLPQPRSSSEHVYQLALQKAWSSNSPMASEETLLIAAQTNNETSSNHYQSRAQGLALHSGSKEASSPVRHRYTNGEAHHLHVEPDLAPGLGLSNGLESGHGSSPARRVIPRVRLQNIVTERQHPEHANQLNTSSQILPEKWSDLPAMPQYSSYETEPRLPTHLDNAPDALEENWLNTYFIEPTNHTSWLSRNNAISVRPSLHVEPDRTSGIWPTLPDEKPTIDHDWGRTRQARQHQQRLDDEQRGNS